jgi:hypothetical protein
MALASAIAAVSLAGSPRVIHCPPYLGHVHQDQTYRRVNAVRIVEVLAINPAYTSAYVPDGYEPAAQQEILARIAALSQQLAILQAVGQRGTGPEPIRPPASLPGSQPKGIPPGTPGGLGLTVLRTKCAACHQQGMALPDQRFVLLDTKGALVTLTPTQKVRVLVKTYSQQMPPPLNTQQIAPLTDGEYAALVDLFQ